MCPAICREEVSPPQGNKQYNYYYSKQLVGTCELCGIAEIQRDAAYWLGGKNRLRGKNQKGEQISVISPLTNYYSYKIVLLT